MPQRIGFRLTLFSMLLALMANHEQAAAAQSGNSSVVPLKLNIVFVYDSSGSMEDKLDGKPKYETARTLVGNMLEGLPADASLGLLAFGHRRTGDCSDLELLAPLGTGNANDIVKTVHGLTPKGKTPLSNALSEAANALKDANGAKMIILLTDGGEECGGDPCAVARKLAESGLVVRVNTIGIRPSGRTGQQLQCIAKEGGGRYFEVRDRHSLYKTISTVQRDILSPASNSATPSDINLLLAPEGGQVLSSGYTTWQNSISGKEEASSWTWPGQEVIFAFKDRQMARFSRFALAIPDTLPQNVQEFELLASDGGPYYSLGRFTTHNGRQESLYQEFAFPETWARYLKFRVISNYGYEMQGWGNTQIFQMRLMGTLLPEYE